MNPFFFPLSFDSSANEPFIVIRKTFFDFRSVHADIAIAALLLAGKDNNGIHLSMFRIILEHAYLNDIDMYEYMKSIYRNDTKIINNLTIHDIYRMPDDASPIDCEYEINKNAYTLMEEVGRVKGLFLNYFNEEKMISPYRFIEWAISCDSIKVPQQMIAWKATQDKKAGQQDIAAALTALAAKDAEMIALKTELEQARQEKAALQAELEKTRAELEKARQTEEVNPKSRNTYLKVIAALANRNGKIDLHERGAAVTISRATEHFGFPVSEDTTRKVIREIIREIEELQK